MIQETLPPIYFEEEAPPELLSDLEKAGLRGAHAKGTLALRQLEALATHFDDEGKPQRARAAEGCCALLSAALRRIAAELPPEAPRSASLPGEG